MLVFTHWLGWVELYVFVTLAETNQEWYSLFTLKAEKIGIRTN